MLLHQEGKGVEGDEDRVCPGPISDARETDETD